MPAPSQTSINAQSFNLQPRGSFPSRPRGEPPSQPEAPRASGGISELEDAAITFSSAELHRLNDRDEREWFRAGDIVEGDDATINFPVCVPWEQRGDPCSEKFNCRCARFQWLVAIDRVSRFVCGFSYTARPRSSYRGEDVLGLMRIVTDEHGAFDAAAKGWPREVLQIISEAAKRELKLSDPERAARK